MARRTLTEAELSTRISDCVEDIGEEWRRFVMKLEQFVVSLKHDVDREDWEGAREMFAIFKTYIRNRTTESVRLSDKLLALKKELKTTRETQGAK